MANAMGVRQVAFVDAFRVDEQNGLRIWNISLTLAEHNSVPEMIKRRAVLCAVPARATSGLADDGIQTSVEYTSTAILLFAVTLSSGLILRKEYVILLHKANYEERGRRGALQRK
ncbi:MAG: hypothetical protein FWG17_02855 [Desulfovibrionaceae bacterium]|nr:hypothetical protein [Desulfovibrionaceae bacterium]